MPIKAEPALVVEHGSIILYQVEAMFQQFPTITVLRAFLLKPSRIVVKNGLCLGFLPILELHPEHRNNDQYTTENETGTATRKGLDDNIVNAVTDCFAF